MLTLKKRIILGSLAAMVTAGLIVIGCSLQAEGERCSVDNGNADCQDGLICVPKSTLTGSADLCCPDGGANDPSCIPGNNSITGAGGSGSTTTGAGGKGGSTATSSTTSTTATTTATSTTSTTSSSTSSTSTTATSSSTGAGGAGGAGGSKDAGKD